MGSCAATKAYIERRGPGLMRSRPTAAATGPGIGAGRLLRAKASMPAGGTAREGPRHRVRAGLTLPSGDPGAQPPCPVGLSGENDGMVPMTMLRSKARILPSPSMSRRSSSGALNVGTAAKTVL